MRIKKTHWGLSALAASAFAVSAVPAQAVQKGDWLIRAGVGHVAPNDSSDRFSGAPTLKVEDVDSSTHVAVNFTYMATDNIGIELLGSLPFEHDIEVTGLGTVAEAKQLPPTLIVLYNFAPKSNVRPYAGAGINYTKFFDEETKGALNGTKISLDSSTGFAAEVGVDVDINKSMFFNASLWYINIETTARSSAAGNVDVDINPLVVFLGVGWRI